MEEQAAVTDVIDSFEQFLKMYEEFRIKNNLLSKINNPYEILTAMTDKLGRICRQVKHFERDDPKADWPNGMVEDMAGLLIYWVLLRNKYELDIADGMRNELLKAAEQHGSRKDASSICE